MCLIINVIDQRKKRGVKGETGENEEDLHENRLQTRKQQPISEQIIRAYFEFHHLLIISVHKR